MYFSVKNIFLFPVCLFTFLCVCACLRVCMCVPVGFCVIDSLNENKTGITDSLRSSDKLGQTQNINKYLNI